jgi:SAM-dependent methyltransferase
MQIEKLRKGTRLFLISFICLFFELALIRYIPGNVRFVAYYSNIVLISAFLGLGIGCLQTGTRRLLDYFPYLVAITIGIIIIFKFLFVKPFSIIPEEYKIQGGLFIGVFPIEILIPVIFVVNAILFFPLGQELGIEIEKFSPLIGYSLNIFGNLLGLTVFSIFSLYLLQPSIWFITGFILVLIYISNNRKILIKSTLIFVLVSIVIFLNSKNERWSPYYKITLLDRIEFKFLWKSFFSYKLQDGIFLLNVDDVTHQFIINFSPEFFKKIESQKDASKLYTIGFNLISGFKKLYEFPYNFKKPQKVLILGAGSGNDVAVAIRKGIKEIDAVDIDPVIVDMGKKYHPEKPYNSESVTVYIDDARSYVSKNTKKYDMIIYGFLDSHRLLSGMSSVRMENYVYTIESLRETKRLLAEDGILSISFASPAYWVSAKIFYMLKEIFGENVRAYEVKDLYFKWLNIFIASPDSNAIEEMPEGFKDITKELLQIPIEREVVPDDNWPFLYLKERKITNEYLFVIGIVLIISFIAVLWTNKKSIKPDLHFFSLGAGFLLLETKSITECAILYGATWSTTSIVVSSFMVMILLSNYLASREWIQKINLNILYLFLFIALIMNYIIPIRVFLPENPYYRSLLLFLFIGTPVLFAGIIFARTFKKVSEAHIALGSNILGCIVGGFAEYTCMIYGIKALYILAIIFYFTSFIAVKILHNE